MPNVSSAPGHRCRLLTGVLMDRWRLQSSQTNDLLLPYPSAPALVCPRPALPAHSRRAVGTGQTGQHRRGASRLRLCNAYSVTARMHAGA